MASEEKISTCHEILLLVPREPVSYDWGLSVGDLTIFGADTCRWRQSRRPWYREPGHGGG